MKKGYTLIELIIVLSIIAVISSITTINIVKFKEKMEIIEFNSVANEVKSLLSFGKAYCRKNKVSGQILVGNNRKTITFEVTNKDFPITKTIKLNKDIEVGSNFKVSSSITSDNNNITDEGYIKSAGTITLTHKSNKRINITVSVGNDIIRSYESDEEEGDIIQ
ncbi:pilus assembly FimT family protein [Clostridium nigeriense]|uniref:pilus assembly FimT family protein n=1 Tax=Clostridium nigeriense TaxID=1805470 RepID=UPI003D35437C